MNADPADAQGRLGTIIMESLFRPRLRIRPTHSQGHRHFRGLSSKTPASSAPPSQSLSHLDRQVPKSKSQTIRNSDPSFLWRTDTRLQLASQASGEVRLNCGSPLCYAGPTGLHCTALSLLELESIREIQRSSPWFACQVPGLARPYSGVHRPMVLLFIALSGQQHKARSCHCLRCRHTIFQQYTTENIQIPAESYQAKC